MVQWNGVTLQYNVLSASIRKVVVDKVIVSAYQDQDGKEVTEHIIDVPTAEEILAQGTLNIANTTEAIRHRVTSHGNGGKAA